jgi:hypothetical protein
MFEFIIAPENTPFAVALLILMIIAILEGVGALFGAGISSIFGGLFPDSNIEIDVADLNSPGIFARALSWLRVGQVPILVLIIVFLLGFGISGLILQNFLLMTFGLMLPAFVAAILAFAISLPIVRVLGSGLNKIIPKDETSAVSKDTFIGRVATITLGESKNGSPAEAKVKDSFGKYHYIMIEPDIEGDIFVQGSKVLLVRQSGSKFYAIKNENQIMNGV